MAQANNTIEGGSMTCPSQQRQTTIDVNAERLLAERRTLELIVLDFVDNAVDRLKQLGKNVATFEKCHVFDHATLLRLLDELASAKREQSLTSTVRKLRDDDHDRIRRVNETVQQLEGKLDIEMQTNCKLRQELTKHEFAAHPQMSDIATAASAYLDGVNTWLTVTNPMDVAKILRQFPDVKDFVRRMMIVPVDVHSCGDHSNIQQENASEK